MNPSATPETGTEQGEPDVLAMLEARISRMDGQPSEEPEGDEQEPETDENEAEEEAEEAESEEEQDADDEDGEEAETPQEPQTFKVKVDGQEQEVTLDELLKGYSRESDYTRKTMALAEEKKALEAAQLHERQQYANNLTQLTQHLQNQIDIEGTKAEIRRLASEGLVEEAFSLNLKLEEQVEVMQQADKEREKAVAEYLKEVEVRTSNYILEQEQRLAEKLPEFADKAKRDVLKKDAKDFLKGKGFSDQDINTLVDHRLWLVVHDAMQYGKAKKSLPAAQEKLKAKPVFAKPGAAKAAPASGRKEMIRQVAKGKMSSQDFLANLIR